MVQFEIALIVDRERARESTGQHDFGRLVGDVSPLYRIKKRKRRQTHLPPLSLLIAKRVTRFTIHGTRPGNAAGRNLRDVGGNFPASPSNPPVASYHFSSLLFRHPFVLLRFCLLRAALWSVYFELFFRRGASSRSFWISLSFRITCRALSSVFL